MEPTPQIQRSWPQVHVHIGENASQQKQILQIRDMLVAVKDYSLANPKRRANAGYVYELSRSVVEVIESLVSAPMLGEDLKELIQSTKAVADEDKQLSTLLRNRVGLPDASSGITGYKDCQRWIKEGIATSCATLFSNTASMFSISGPAPPVEENKLRIRVRVKDHAIAKKYCIANEVEGQDSINKAIRLCSELDPIHITSFTQLQSGNVEL